MSGRMNWGRVNQENRAFQHGSEWIGSESEFLRDSTPRKNKHKARRKEQTSIPLSQRDPNCTCGKSKSFSGEHKKSCPRRAKPAFGPASKPPVAARPLPVPAPGPGVVPKFTEEQFQEAMSKLRRSGKLLQWLTLARERAACDKSLLPVERISTINKIEEILKQL